MMFRYYTILMLAASVSFSAHAGYRTCKMSNTKLPNSKIIRIGDDWKRASAAAGRKAVYGSHRVEGKDSFIDFYARGGKVYEICREFKR